MMLATLSCQLFGCGKEGGSGSVSESEQETESAALPDITRKIHDILELNTTEYPLDSAAGEEQYSTLMMNYRLSYTLASKNQSGIQAYYPRIKVLADGSYFLIYHDNMHGGSVYYAFSEDCVEWTRPQVLFAATPITVNGVADTKCYMTPDACVLSDGRLVAITSYRAGASYQKAIAPHGVCVKFSEDNGKTWGEEQVIYVGTNWEPSIIEGNNGEIVAFFTCIAPTLYQYGSETSPNFDHRSGGAGCVRSKDGGKTWEPNVTGAPYIPQYAMRQYMFTDELGIKRYNDQMPVPLLLNNGTMTLVVESWNMQTNAYKFSIAYSTDNFAEDVGMDKTGPADRQSNLFPLAGPYMSQFPSGEVVLTQHSGSGSFYYRLADCTARTFYDPKTLWSKDAGMWGSTTTVDSHSAVITVGSEHYEIMIARMMLNHRLHIKKMTPSLIADTSEWDGNTDALFCGSKSQAQVSVRVGYDDDNIYLLGERLDKQLTSDDGIIFYLSDGSASGFYRVAVGNEGITEFVYKASNSAQAEAVDFAAEGVKAAVYVDGTVGDRATFDNGVIYELAIPRSLLKEEGRLQLIFDLVNSDREGDKPETDMSNPDATFRKKDNWFIASFE